MKQLRKRFLLHYVSSRMWFWMSNLLLIMLLALPSVVLFDAGLREFLMQCSVSLLMFPGAIMLAGGYDNIRSMIVKRYHK